MEFFEPMKPLEPKGGGWENCGPSIGGDGVLFIKGNETVISSVRFYHDKPHQHIAIMRRRDTDFAAILREFGAQDFEEDGGWSAGLCKHFWKKVEP